MFTRAAATAAAASVGRRATMAATATRALATRAAPREAAWHLPAGRDLQVRWGSSTRAASPSLSGRPASQSGRASCGCSQVPHPFVRCGTAVARRWHGSSCACCSAQGLQDVKAKLGKGAKGCTTGYAPMSSAGSLPITPQLWSKLSGEDKADYNPLL